MRIILLLLFVSTATAADIITLSNNERLINKNENVTLKCPTSDGDDYNQQQQNNLVKWLKNDEKLLINGNKKLKILDAYLKIRNFNVYDIGLYKCQIINGNGQQRVFNITLKMNLTNKEINELLFNYDSAEHDVEEDDDQLSSHNNNDEDAEITIDDNAQSYDYYMRGGEAPSFTDLDTLVTKKFYKLEKSDLELNCNARGVPVPEITWLKNNQIISEEDIGNTRNSMVLKIKDLNIHDNGNYTCQLTNEYGKINRTFTVNIYENLSFNGVEPLNQTVIFASNVKFKCDLADGYNKQNAQIMWLVQQRKDAAASSSSSNLSVEINGELYVYAKSDSNADRVQTTENYLLINQATYSDIGYYLCIINNSKGYNYRRAYLNVLPSSSLTNQILFSSSSNSVSTQNIPIITILVVIISSISAFTILALFIYFCKNKTSKKLDRKKDLRCSKKTVISIPKQLQHQQQLLPLNDHQHVIQMPHQAHYVKHYTNNNNNNYPTKPPHTNNTTSTFVSNSLRKSIGSHRSSNVNTTNTNSTTVTKLNDFNYDIPTAQRHNNVIQPQAIKPQPAMLYQMNITDNRLPEYDNYLNINQKLLQQQHQQVQILHQQHTLLDSVDYDDDMIGWSDSSSNMSRPYAKIQYN